MADALAADDADEFFGKIVRAVRKAAPIVGKIARFAAPVLSAIPHPAAQIGSKVAGVLGKLRAEGASEDEALEAVAELAVRDRRALPVVAGLAARSLTKSAGRYHVTGPATAGSRHHEARDADPGQSRRTEGDPRHRPGDSQRQANRGDEGDAGKRSPEGGAAHDCQSGAQPLARPQAVASVAERPATAAGNGDRWDGRRHCQGTAQLQRLRPGADHDYRQLIAAASLRPAVQEELCRCVGTCSDASCGVKARTLRSRARLLVALDARGGRVSAGRYALCSAARAFRRCQSAAPAIDRTVLGRLGELGNAG